MRKLNLVAMSYDRNSILNALSETNAVEVKLHAETEGTTSLPEGGEELFAYLNGLESALSILETEVERYKKEHDIKEAPVKDGFAVRYSDFLSAKEKKGEIEALAEKINGIWDSENICTAEQAKLMRAIAAAKPYEKADLPFKAYVDTPHTKTRLGVVNASAWENLKKSLDELPLAAYDAKTGDESVLVTIKAHKSAWSETENLLSGAGFTLCPYTGDQTGAEMLSDLLEQKEKNELKKAELQAEMYSLAPAIKDYKIYCDYVGFELEKAQLSAKLRGTDKTFLLEAFVPAEQEGRVKEALDKTSGAVFYEFSDPAEDEQVPTLLKNNAIVTNFETITNMYSAPDAREFDPNTVMAFFYSVFLGFIMGDIGYGLFMLLGGGFLYFKNRAKAGGIKSLAGVFAIGGVFAILWGFMFNSLFGIQILPFTVMPDAQNGRWTFVGIQIPSVLIISMLIGIIQIFAGYLCKAYQEWRVGSFWDGVWDGVVWAVFSVGAGLAIVGLVEEFALGMFATVGGIVAAAALALAVLTAGRHEKFFGKFTKGFGSLYGIINYVSDILSYARLYGLMLSGAVIAQIISQYAVDFITGGNIVFAVLGVFLMVVGHVFNLAMGLLGAYIHDARLQYVEFYGRFYHGEGELFTPLGSKKKYINLEKAA